MLILPEFEETIQIYEEVISNLCHLFIELGISDNPIEVYETFLYMLQNGYLSLQPYSDKIPKAYISLESNGFIPMDTTGSMLLTGYGVCRHTTDFLSYIYHSLGYENSSLSTYHPDLKINVIVKNPAIRYLTNPEGQKYIDEATSDIDLFGKLEIHTIKKYKDVDVIIDYYPPDLLFNHIMNIVKSNEDDTTHIVDSRYHCVGKRLNFNSIELNNSGLTHVDFINPNPEFPVYYDTDYHKGLILLQGNINIEKDVSESIIYRELCKRFRKRYEEFRNANKENYIAVKENYKKMIKRLER